MVDRLEGLCDAFNEPLPELTSFVLPGGTAASAGLHVARTVCRRAERETLVAAGEHDVNPLVAVYLNRLSDLLFILARAANALADADEPLWKPGAALRLDAHGARCAASPDRRARCSALRSASG